MKTIIEHMAMESDRNINLLVNKPSGNINNQMASKPSETFINQMVNTPRGNIY
jgi:hypothetical protein